MLRIIPKFCRASHPRARRKGVHTSQLIGDPPNPQSSEIKAISPYQSDSSTSGDASKSLVRSSVPSAINADPRTYTKPPFNTHAFVQELGKTFPTTTATSLMRATRALLVDRTGKVRREGLTTKDLENQAYLFRAALSELRGELTTYIRNNSASISASTNTMRKDVERLNVKMKEEIGSMKHEIQMELETRKNEAKAELKLQDIAIEELLSKVIVNVSDLRTDVEEVKWENMRRTVMTLFAFIMVIVASMEIKSSVDSPTRLPPPPLPPPSPPPYQGTERAD